MRKFEVIYKFLSKKVQERNKAQKYSKMNIIEAIKTLDNNELLQFIKETERRGNHGELMQICESDQDEEGNLLMNCTALQLSLKHRNSTEVVLKLIEVGGRQLVMGKDGNGENAMHFACYYNASFEVILKLIEIGEREIVLEKSEGFGANSLHWACVHSDASLKVIQKLVELGGQELVLAEDKNGDTPLHNAFRNKNVSVEIIKKLIAVGGREILELKNEDGETALFYDYFNWMCSFFNEQNPNYYDIFALLVREGIIFKVGGEYGLGGIFNSVDRKVQTQIYDKWEKFAPSLKLVMESFQEPILQAAILARVPSHIIQEIANHYDCVLNTDSQNRYPICVAMEEGLEWDKGMQHIVNTTAISMKRPIAFVAAEYGLKWNNHMKEVVESSIHELIDGHDSLSRLRLFMVAASGDHCDLNSIYSMMRMSPEINS